MWQVLHICLLLPLLATPLPTHVAKSASFAASVDASAEPPITFDGGNVGVNFLGYKASAGLGGLLGGGAQGGLHAEAGTPYGQSAAAGLGGAVDGSGKAAGGLYAGATAGAGVSADAGLAGASIAGAGETETHITKITHKAPATAEFTAHVAAAPVVHKEVEIIEEQPKPQTTYVQRTVIPNYVEKTIQVPSYVEKTIRVPTTVEKTIRVPAEPTIIEKEVQAPAAVGYTKEVVKEVEVPQTVTYVQKTKVHGHRRPHIHSRTYYKNIGYGGGFGAGYGGGFGGGYGAGGGGSYTATVSKRVNPQFFSDIFNIPISTLGAVSKFVSGIAGSAGGSVSVSKSVGVAGGKYY